MSYREQVAEILFLTCVHDQLDSYGMYPSACFNYYYNYGGPVLG